MLRILYSFALVGFALLMATATGIPAQGADSDEASHHAQEHDESHGGAVEDHGHAHAEEGGHVAIVAPSLFWIWPFVTLLLCIAILPLIPATEHWWHKNSSKLIASAILAAITIGYYWTRDHGFPHGDHVLETGAETVKAVLHHAVIADYIPFIVLLFSLFVISGGINIKGDVPAHPLTNVAILALGGLIASFIGTTGAAMLLIRPLLQINQERTHVVHTVVFFIFVVCNIGGCLLPIGDPPLFLGYLRGVPFLWTFNLVVQWAVCLALVLFVYYIWDSIAWRREPEVAIDIDEAFREPIRVRGLVNFLLLLGVVLAVGLLVPGKKVLGFEVPHWEPVGLREFVQLGLAAISFHFTSKAVRRDNEFSFFAIAEVACLFIGIFITMQVPIEFLNTKGAEMGLTSPVQFFWATGILSSFLDNAPTYVVFFQTAGTMPWENSNELMHGVLTAKGTIPIPLLIAISLGSVFMGAMTYIGNGPNFMVRSIAAQAGVKMPSFFGYMLYSIAVLIPVFILITIIFL